MDIQLPSQSLSPFIRHFMIIESQDEVVNRVLPGTALVMAFRFKGRVNQLEGSEKRKLPAAMISGLRKSGRLINYSKDAGNILVQFREAGANAFIKEPLHEFFGESPSLDLLTGYHNVSEMEEQLAEAKDNQTRIALVEDFLIAKLYDHKPDQLILKALEKIQVSKGNIRMTELAHQLCISQDAFEKRFRKVVGVSPKQFSFIVRMQSVINDVRTNKQALNEIAFHAGYFDQPHFNKDFKLFTGQTPKDFFKSPVFG
ncbi:MAG TPA: helix-turn-helix transcriptional regulator [Cyclobacteriaceae bacterium]